ncbi:hypothetical protein TNCT_434211 [Trichonephila clavata]|uniref:Uncharacterized protein n=1 Tax=Trichonephila clavata TaxID=2740835 RepID=A0A8X6FYW6_TRICU|nr:hypothetical protein TNCT_434211 [Trichonephila clavata]
MSYLGFCEFHSYFPCSSSKNLWVQTCKGMMQAEGVYSSRCETSSKASGGALARNTFCHGCAEDLREPELRIVFVHFPYLLLGRNP